VALIPAILRLLALLPLAIVLPAAAQTKLAQQCASFGEAQYRKLSPSVDRVTALDFPPPALERVDAKVGSQAIAAALTLRGRLTYRSGSPFETQFVCLLDAGQRPLFFYALPTLATRSAPTPVTRGGAPGPVPPLPSPASETPTMALGPQAALPAPEPARPALPASAVRLRGLARDLGGRLQFLPCDGAPLPLEDRTPDQELTQALRGLTAGQNGRPMFVEIYGGRETGPGSGISALELGVGNGSTSANGWPMAAAAAAASRRGALKSRRGTCCGASPVASLDSVLPMAGRRSWTAQWPTRRRTIRTSRS
jgi:hypothetical protein